MAYTQADRMCQVKSPLGDDVLLLAEMTAHESISGPFVYELQLLSETDDIDFAAVIGKPLAVHLKAANDKERWYHGIVSRFAQGPSQGRFASYSAEVVPWIWLLRRRAGCRIFKPKPAPDIIRELLAETDFGDVEFQLVGEFPEREYCVQYRETDLNFISRLAEEEGIAYFFKHSEKQHTLVFFNSPSGNAPCPGQATVAYAKAIDENVLGGSIHGFRVERELASGKYALTDYNFEDPAMSLLATTSSSTSLGGNEKFEIYDHPGEYLKLSEGERRVKLRMQAEEAAAISIRGQSDCAAFVPGYRFTLVGHPRDAYNESYLITEVRHHVSQDVGDAGTESTYMNELSCVPHSVPMRPLQRTPKPLITGVQTATVVGAAGKEIDVDAHGRVVLQFHWDREGKRDENSSCRVRVSQNWAGKNWGMISNPRIGQEVIVEFIEGDPDRPIVTGRVYNGEQTVPYALPANATQTGIKTRSSLSGAAANFNEIRFEDKKGEEQLFIHAEKNQDIEVEKDETQWVGNDRKTKIDHDEQHDVKNDRGRTVGNDESVSIGQLLTLTVGKNRVVDVSADDSLTVGGKRKHDVAKDETISVGDNQSLSVGKDRSISVEGKFSTAVSKDWTLNVSQSASTDVTKAFMLTAKTITLQADDQILIQTGSAKIVLKKSGDISIEGSKIQLKASGDVILKGSKIQEN